MAAGGGHDFPPSVGCAAQVGEKGGEEGGELFGEEGGRRGSVCLSASPQRDELEGEQAFEVGHFPLQEGFREAGEGGREVEDPGGIGFREGPPRHVRSAVAAGSPGPGQEIP